MVREVLKLYTDNGLGNNNPAFRDIEITDYTHSEPRMGMPTLKATLKYGICLDEEWTGREYVTIRNERFYIRHTPSSYKDNSDQRYVHEIEFHSERDEILANVFFCDAVYEGALTYDKPCSNSTTVTFFGNIRELADRINCALRYRGVGDSILNTKTYLTTADTPVGDGYCIIVDEYGAGDFDYETSYEFSFEDQYLWDVITTGYETTEIPFAMRGKAVVFGAVPVVVERTFRYGHDNELLKVSKTNANAKVINRITMLGSSENIPYYYPNPTEYGHIEITTPASQSHLQKEDIEVANYSQLLATVKTGDAVLRHKPDSVASANVTVKSAFDNGSFEDYTMGSTIKHEPITGHQYNAKWHLRVRFAIREEYGYEIRNLSGAVWYSDTAGGEVSGSMVNGIVDYSIREVGSSALASTAGMSLQEDVLKLGTLAAGEYELELSFRIPNMDDRLKGIVSFCRLDGITIDAEGSGSTAGFFWECGGQQYRTGELGIRILSGLSMDMVGEKFTVVSNGRLPFQTRLMPSKYRDSLGEERFYNAVNNTYTDPDTGNKYLFKNPYVEGAPVEHIFKDDKEKPTITGIKNSTGWLFGAIADVTFDSNDGDSLSAGNDESESKNDSLKYEHPYFYIRINKFDGPYGFDLFKQASQTDPMTIQMTSGSCNGCKFKIQAVEFKDETGLVSFKNPVQTVGNALVSGGYEDKVSKTEFVADQQDSSKNSIWLCVQKDAETFGMIMPNRMGGFFPKKGDTFNITNIDLPQGYILAAEKRLEENGIRCMSDNNEEQFNFGVEASRIFFAENPDILAEIDAYSKLKIEYNGRVYEQYVSELRITCRDNEALPDIDISLAQELSVGPGFEQRVAERVSSLIANAGTMGGVAGRGGLPTSLNDKRYINKQRADRTPYKVSSDIGFEIGDFVSGSQGGIFHIDQETGRSYLEVDVLKARMKAVFEAIQVAHLESIGGEQGITPGGSILISYVEKTDTAYRCYFKGKDSDKGAECRFVAGDQVKCLENNIMSGTSEEASNKYYWRLVTAVNNDMSYFDLSLTDYDTISEDLPKAGDTVMQLGNRKDKSRQSAIIMSTINGSAPSVTLYSGIDHYSLNEKAVVEYGVDKTKNPPEPFFHCYGSFYFGPRNLKTYLEFDASSGDMVFNGKFTATCTVGDKVLADYIKEVAPPVEQEDIEGFVNNIVNPKIDGIQNQIDGVIETWFYNGVPTLTNYPASGWNTNDLKIQHLGDLYYDNDTGTAYRFSQNADGSFYWNKITDEAITKALAAAQKAQDTADGKRRVFTSQPTNADVYDVGDLWVNATYGTQYTNDILRCIAHKGAGAPFKIEHWGLASNYTDDSALNTFIAGYQTTIGDIQKQMDGKAETWYQATDPSTDWTTADMKKEHKGDLWYCTADIAGTNFKKGTTWYWNGTAWEQQDVPESVFDAIDGKADIFVSKPTSGYHKNDLWFLEADYTLSNVKYKSGTLVVAIRDMGTSWSANDWIKKDRYTDDTLAQEAIKNIADYEYLKKALQGASQTLGGLFLSSYIKLGEWDMSNPDEPVFSKAWSGLNGIVSGSLGGRTPSFFAGGDMIDRFDKNDNFLNEAGKRYAASMIRMDGSAYFADGKAGFRPNGSGWLAGDNIRWETDGSLTLGNGIKIDLGGSNTTLGEWGSKLTGVENTLGSLTTLVNALSNVLVPVDSSGNRVAWDSSALFAVKSVKGFYSKEFISARGQNPNGAGGAGVTLLSALNDVELSNLAGGQALVYNGSKWVNQAVGGGLDEGALATYLSQNGYAKQSWVEAKGYITASALTGYATQSWVQQQGYLTQHQPIYALTLQSGAFMASTYNPKSAAATVNIPTTTSHISEGTNLYFTNARAVAALKATTDTLQANINKKLDITTFNEFKAVFDSMFVKEADANSPDGYRIKAKFGLYSNYYISARGVNPNGAGGAGVTLLSALNDVELSNLAGGQALVYNGSKWVNQAVERGLDEGALATYLSQNGYAKQAWVEAKGYATQSWVSANFNKYELPTASASVKGGVKVGSGLTIASEVLAVSLSASHIPALPWSKITTGKPTTLAGYGITDAKIANGVITLGASTIEPLVSASLKALTFQSGAFSAKSYTPTAAATVNIPTTTSHISEGSNLYFTNARAVAALKTVTDTLQANIDKKLDIATFNTFKALFDSMFVKEADANSPDGYRIKAKYGLYSNYYISARGANPNGGGGTGGGLIQTVYGSSDFGGSFSDSVKNNTFNAYAINTLHTRILNTYTKSEADSLLGNKADKTWVTGGFVTAGVIEGSNNMNELNGNTSFIKSVNATSNMPSTAGWYNVIQLAHRNGAGDGPGYVGQIALGMTVNHEQMYFRTHRTRTWQHVLTSSNYASVLDGRYYTESEINTKLAGYQAKGNYVTTDTTQTLQGVKYLKGGSGLHASVDTSNYEDFKFVNANATSVLGYIGYHNVVGKMYISAKGNNPDPWSDVVGKYQLRLSSAGDFTFNTYPIWHAGNDGSGSGLDADLLDGYHISNYQTGGWNNLTAYNPNSNTNYARYSHKLFNLDSAQESILRFRVTTDTNYPSYGEWVLRVNHATNYGKNVTLAPAGMNASGLNLTVYIDSSYGVWVQSTAIWSNRFQYRVEAGALPTVISTVSGTPSNVVQTIVNCGMSRNGASYQSLIFQGNASSATKLQTARSLWGQSFDGSGNVSGNMTGVGSISFLADTTYNIGSASSQARYIYTGGLYAKTGSNLWLGANNANQVLIDTSGNVGIGTTNPWANLDINGYVRSSGTVYVGAGRQGFSDGKAGVILNSAGGIEISQATPYIDFHFNNSTADYTTRLIEEASGRLAIIGTLRVSAGMYSNGYVSARGSNSSSDQRMKSYITPIKLRMEDILSAPSVRYRWKDTGKKDIGTIAQYWLPILPEAVGKDGNGFYTVDYGKLAHIEVVSLAKNLVPRLSDNERRIKKLERKIIELEKKLAEYAR